MIKLLLVTDESNVLDAGTGHHHPVNPDSDAGYDYASFVSNHPYLLSHDDYLQFVRMYAGLRLYSKDDSRGSFLHATVFGSGRWAFADECLDPVTQGVYHVFAVVEYRLPALPGELQLPDIISGYAFDTSGRPGVFAETHSAGEPESAFRIYCKTFAEWFDRFQSARGALVAR